MPDKPKILIDREVASSKLFRVNEAHIEFSNGERRVYEYLRSGHNAAVIIVPLIDDNTVLLVEEYGVGVDGYELGLPKGRVDQGESHLQAANRELKEEVGYGAKKLELLKSISLSPNYMQHMTQIVLARDLYPESAVGDEPEPLGVVPFNFNDIASIASLQNVTEARTIAALYLARDWVAQHTDL